MTVPERDEIERLRAARERVLGRIADACARVGRDPAGVTLVAVTKTVDVDRVQAAVAAGLTVLGENRVQEAESKVPLVDGATWHLIGPLQSNKARRALEIFDVIETVESSGQADRLERINRESLQRTTYPVLLQVNVDRDPAKSGFTPEELEQAAGDWIESGLEVRGLMTVGRLVADAEAARPTFVALRALSEWLRTRWPALGPELSMGMTDDFEVAVEEGATIVRVGRALFGERPPAIA